MSGNDKVTTIRLKQSTKDVLCTEGNKGQTYETIILNLVKTVREYRRTCG